MASARLRVGQFVFANLHEATSVKGRYRLTHLCAHSLLILFSRTIGVVRLTGC